MRQMEEAFRAKLQLADEQKSEWRRDAALELDTERQKNKQLLHKYNTEYQKLQDTLAVSVQSATQELKEEVSALKALLRECQEDLRSAREEASKREERLLREREEDLRNVREEASGREERILREHQAEVDQVQHQLQNLQQEVEELQQAHRDVQQLKRENCTLHDEVRLLQETVRRECEERAELTAALSLAREQLLGVRQTPPNSSVPRSPASSSLPSLSAGHGRDSEHGGRNAVSWHGNPRQPLPSLPPITTEKPVPRTETRRRKDKR